jgi:uncharacterized protein
MDEQFFEDLKEKIQPYFEGVNSCHDFSHTERVKNLALQIGEKEGADLEIIEIAALLHDIARKEQDESKGKICHASRGVEMARKLLEEQKYNPEKIEKIIHCIATHRFRDEKNSPKSKEAKILFDADKLDSIGAVGLLRAASFSGHIGAKIHNTLEEAKNGKDYSKEDTVFREFLIKLSKIKDKCMTETGRRIAESRHHFMEDFFDKVNKEFIGEQ